MADKREFPHHMIKEIFEQPQGLHDTIAPRISLPEGVVQLNEVPISARRTSQAAAASTSLPRVPAAMPAWPDST